MREAALLCAFVISASSQTPLPKVLDFNKHVWVSYSGEHAILGRWGAHFDAQWRRSESGTRWQQYQLRPGLNYRWKPNVLLTAGYAFTKAYPYGEFPVREAFPEHRVYQQARVGQSWGSLRLQHRTRFEQRRIRYPRQLSWTYQNRFRYMAKVEIPLGKTSTGSGDWYLPMYDEILIGIPPNYGARAFDQNRLFIGIGHNLRNASVEAGLTNQFLGQRNGRIFESNNTLLLTFTSSYSLSTL